MCYCFIEGYKSREARIKGKGKKMGARERKSKVVPAKLAILLKNKQSQNSTGDC